jgi:hypothetical protein
MNGREFSHTVTLVNGVCDAEADVEAVKELSEIDRSCLARASTKGRLYLLISGATKVGNPDFTINDLQGSVNGTDYLSLLEFTAISKQVTGPGFLLKQEILDGFPRSVTHIKLMCSVALLNGSNKITLNAGIEAEA